MGIIVVTAGVICRGEKILLAQRVQGDPLGGLWEFPGGKIIPGESPEDCLVREIREELEMDIEVGEIFQVVSHVYPGGKHILLLAYLCRHLRGEGIARECQDFRWVTPGQLMDFPMPEADWPIRDKLMGRS
ncbi:MAG: (deoxy)nucleoside triphosphate pyrophosphohydrolase [Clostridia bacterium]|nr:(deoxy)nucleoside triphosphate pyrophosphohydrolase [Clostridia bacterium]